MEVIRKLAPDNLTVHSLAIKRAARLNIQRERYQDFEIVNTADHIALTSKVAEEMGLFPVLHSLRFQNCLPYSSGGLNNMGKGPFLLPLSKSVRYGLRY